MTHILLRWLTLLVFLLVSLTITPAIAAEEQIYTIKKGDTLWDLSQRFIDDPYYWPNVWAKNPNITNPHLIFPGQKIRILDGKLHIIPAYPEASKNVEEAIDLTAPENTKTSNALTISAGKSGNGFILTTERPLGFLVDSVDNRILLTENDTVFIKMKNLSDVNIGDTYSLYSRGKEIKHPRTNQNVGTMMNNLGHLKVTEIKGQTVIAKIGDAFREITRGAELFAYSAQQTEITLLPGSAKLNGYIVATRDNKGTIATNDIIFIDRGSKNGIANGNLFYISRARTASKELLKKAGSVQLPDAVLGAAIVVETRAKTASAIVIKSADAAYIGDKISIVSK